MDQESKPILGIIPIWRQPRTKEIWPALPPCHKKIDFDQKHKRNQIVTEHPSPLPHLADFICERFLMNVSFLHHLKT